MSEKKISSLTPQQEAQLPVYLERYRNIGLNTEPTDRAAAEVAFKEAYKYLKLKEPEIFWEVSPFAGARKAAELAAGTKDVTKEMIVEQASKASYGTFEAYWVSFYSFIGEQLDVKKDELLSIVNKVVKETGVYWTFEDAVVLTEKPVAIHMQDGKLHNVNGKALEYSDGSGVFAYKGIRYPSLIELKLASVMDQSTDEKTG